MRQPVSMRIQLIIFTIMIFAAGALWAKRQEVNAFLAQANTKEAAGRREKSEALPVIVDTVLSDENSENIEALGTGRAVRFVTLYPETAGEIMALSVKPGDEVKKGQLILTLDVRDAELAKKVAETKVLEARRLAARSSELQKKKITSKANVDDAQTRLERAELELDQAIEALEDRKVLAPFDGVIGIPNVEPGDRVTTTTALMTLDDRSQLIVEFEVPELFISRLSLGNKIVAQTPTFERKQFMGSITAIDSRIDPSSRSVKVRALLPNNADLLRPGMSFSTRVKLKGETYPLIPELALLWSKGKSYVWKITNKRAKRTPVEIIKRLNSTLLVQGELARGDLVVVEGVQRLREDAKVSYQKPQKPLSRFESMKIDRAQN